MKTKKAFAVHVFNNKEEYTGTSLVVWASSRAEAIRKVKSMRNDPKGYVYQALGIDE